MNFEAIAAFAAPRLLSVLRIITALLLLQHAASKLFGFPHVAYFDNLPVLSLLGIAGLLELIGGALLLFGVATRLVSFILSGEMAFAYFIGHAPNGFFPMLNLGEPAVLLCFILLYLAAAGGGEWSLSPARGARLAAA
ncbi:MAG: DoxX family protein [Methylobacteriaceae bacterium]|nr:DoxX family protein [Methylobacteriaceae bacterium]MBV9244871.1 DoxX family protein [Methylobacteriaceae bacterium]MBV9636573.1 DoxX family protein [Methylobacteriaceae bacterium]